MDSLELLVAMFWYVVAMFGGSLQYEPEFFWTVMIVGTVVGVALDLLIPYLFRKLAKALARLHDGPAYPAK